MSRCLYHYIIIRTRCRVAGLTESALFVLNLAPFVFAKEIFESNIGQKVNANAAEKHVVFVSATTMQNKQTGTMVSVKFAVKRRVFAFVSARSENTIGLWVNASAAVKHVRYAFVIDPSGFFN